LHLVWLWLAACVTVVLLSQVMGAGMLDGGFGSAIFGVLLLFGAPFVVVGRLGVAATSWAPAWVQALVSITLILVVTAFADRVVTRWLSRGAAQ
jgi:hypothetical protein